MALGEKLGVVTVIVKEEEADLCRVNPRHTRTQLLFEILASLHAT